MKAHFCPNPPTINFDGNSLKVWSLTLKLRILFSFIFPSINQISCSDLTVMAYPEKSLLISRIYYYDNKTELFWSLLSSIFSPKIFLINLGLTNNFIEYGKMLQLLHNSKANSFFSWKITWKQNLKYWLLNILCEKSFFCVQSFGQQLSDFSFT